MNIMPNISIIIPLYNVAEYIEQCLQSVANQTYKGVIECIIVDDCGTDNSVQIVEDYIANYNGSIQFRLLHHECNRGLSAARNTGLEAATGEYVYFLDSDDWISDDCLETLTTPLKNKLYEMVVGNYELRDGFMWVAVLDMPTGEIIGSNDCLASLVQFKVYMMAWNKLVSRKFLVENCITFYEGLVHEDELWSCVMMSKLSSMYIENKTTYYYRVRMDSITTMQELPKKYKRDCVAYQTILKEVAPYLQNSGLSQITYFNYCRRMFNGVLQLFQHLHLSYRNFYIFYRNEYNFDLLKLLKNGDISLTQVKKNFHFLLPVRLGYAYLRLRDFKNNLCK